jgi:flagellar motor switch protein FliM
MENIAQEVAADSGAAAAATSSFEVQPPLLQPPPKERDLASEQACTDLVPVTPPESETSDLPERMLALPTHLKQIPFRLELRVPLSRLTLRDLQSLQSGSLLMTEHLSVRDLILTAAGERLLLVELESVEQQLAARVKRLAWRHKWRRTA